MSLKDSWKDLEDKVQGDPDSGSDISVEPINLIAHSVIEAENNIESIQDNIESIAARTTVNGQNISAIADEVVKIQEDISSLENRTFDNEETLITHSQDISANSADIAINKENINANSDEISKLKELVIKTDASGVDFNITDAAQMPLESLNIYGKTNQVHTTGKNLFCCSSAYSLTESGVTATADSGTSVIKVSGKATANFYLGIAAASLPAGTYTLSMSGLLGANDYVFLKNTNTSVYVVPSLKNGKSGTFTITEASGFVLGLVILSSSDYAYSDATVYLQIESGETATDYEPYSNGVASPSPEYPQPMETIGLSGKITINVDEQTLDVETPNGLPGIPTQYDGNYTDENGQNWICDEIDFEKGVYIQRIEEITIPEFEDVELITNNSGDEIYVGVVLISERTDVRNALCEVAKRSWNSGSNTLNSNEFILVDDPDGTYIEIVAFAESEDEFRNKFEGKKMLLAFSEPIETHTLSDEQVSLYKSIYTNKSITHIFNDANAHVKVGYIAHTKNYIDNIVNNKYTALETAIISLGGNV